MVKKQHLHQKCKALMCILLLSITFILPCWVLVLKCCFFTELAGCFMAFAVLCSRGCLWLTCKMCLFLSRCKENYHNVKIRTLRPEF